MALSSVALNLPSQVFKPLVSLFSPIEPSVYEARGRLPREQLGETRLDYDRTFQLASAEAARLGIAEPIGELYYSFEYNFFGAGFGDHDDPMGKSWLFFHGSDGTPARPGSRRAGQLGRAFLPLAVPDPRRAHRRPAGTHRHRRPRPGHRRAVADRCLHLVAQAPGAPLERPLDGC